ncbi:MAG: EAL domain-containing protein [Leptospirales bacterium]|jgi:EAL domain-containing protein (putative c-di-GMP-specific phosphodiesterase class I)
MAGCKDCRTNEPLGFEFTMAFQPIVDVQEAKILSYEALARGLNQEGAGAVLARVNDSNRYQFDQSARVKAIELAAGLGLETLLNINFLPNAVYRPETCIQKTLEASETHRLPASRLMFEITEGEEVTDHEHIRSIFSEYKRQGIQTAIDDFGAGYSGLNLLAEFQPDWIKLDMKLVRGIQDHPPRVAIIRGILSVCAELGIQVIAEGIETRAEYEVLRDLGVRYYQGFYFGRPGFEFLPAVDFAAFAG